MKGKGSYAIKIADFGNSQIMTGEEMILSSIEHFPVRWTSPEVLKHMKLTKANDVWSFGN